MTSGVPNKDCDLDTSQIAVLFHYEGPFANLIGRNTRPREKTSGRKEILTLQKIRHRDIMSQRTQ